MAHEEREHGHVPKYRCEDCWISFEHEHRLRAHKRLCKGPAKSSEQLGNLITRHKRLKEISPPPRRGPRIIIIDDTGNSTENTSTMIKEIGESSYNDQYEKWVEGNIEECSGEVAVKMKPPQSLGDLSGKRIKVEVEDGIGSLTHRTNAPPMAIPDGEEATVISREGMYCTSMESELAKNTEVKEEPAILSELASIAETEQLNSEVSPSTIVHEQNHLLTSQTSPSELTQAESEVERVASSKTKSVYQVLDAATIQSLGLDPNMSYVLLNNS